MQMITDGQALDNPVLAAWLGSARLGFWSMEAAALNRIETLIREHKPRTVVELGSGLSTLCIAHYVSDYGGTLISLEEHAGYAANVRQLLTARQLEATVLYAPVRGFQGYHFYDLEYCYIDVFLKERPIDLLIVDGPKGGASRRRALDIMSGYMKPLNGTGRLVGLAVIDDAKRDRDHITQWVSDGLLSVTEHGQTDKGFVIGEVL